MKLKSKGLGRKELVMDFREYVVTNENHELIIRGTIHDPVHWDFTITMCEDDLPGLIRVATRRQTIGLLVRSFFKPRKRHHWKDERKEHISAAIEHRRENLERFKNAPPEGETPAERRRLARAKAAESAAGDGAAGSAEGGAAGDGGTAADVAADAAAEASTGQTG